MKYITGGRQHVGHSIISKNDSLEYAYNTLKLLNSQLRIPALIVSDQTYLFHGLLTEKDILAFIEKTEINLNDVTVEYAYNRNPKYVITSAELDHHKVNDTDPFENLPPNISFMPLIDDNKKFVNFVYNKKFYKPQSFHVSVDIGNACQLKCPSCERGQRVLKNSSDFMDLSLFEKIVKKSKEIGSGSIAFFNYAEPLLVENLYQYIDIVKNYGIPRIELSTNFSFKEIPNFNKLLDSCFSTPHFTRLYVSVSGFTQETYKNYHKGGNIEYVKKNLEHASNYKLENKDNSDIWVRYLTFDYNREEAILFREYAKKIGITFETRVGDSFDRKSAKTLMSGLSNLNDPLFYENDEAVTAQYLSGYYKVSSKRSRISFLICDVRQNLVLDYKGDVYLCPCVPPREVFKIGNFVQDSLDDILINQFLHPRHSLCGRAKTLPISDDLRKALMNAIENQAPPPPPASPI